MIRFKQCLPQDAEDVLVFAGPEHHYKLQERILYDHDSDGRYYQWLDVEVVAFDAHDTDEEIFQP